jgi:methionyl-tRNA formyltransferase
MRVLFLGTPDFAVPSLRALISSIYEISAVFTQPDRPSGRGHHLQAPPIKEVARQAGIPIYQPARIRDEANRALVETFHPDFIVVVAYGQILPAWLLAIPRFGAINVHGSLLPRYRGAAPVVWSILNGDRTTGITTMLMDEQLDTGPILLQRELHVPQTATAGELATELANLGADLLISTLDGVAAGTIPPIAQDDSLATYAPRIKKEMAQIDWNRAAPELYNLVRAMNPWPFAHSWIQNRQVQIFRAAVDAGASHDSAPGTFLGVTGEGMKVACGAQTVLEVLELQMESRKRVVGRDFAAGARLKAPMPLFGDHAPDRENRP